MSVRANPTEPWLDDDVGGCPATGERYRLVADRLVRDEPIERAKR